MRYIWRQFSKNVKALKKKQLFSSPNLFPDYDQWSKLVANNRKIIKSIEIFLHTFVNLYIYICIHIVSFRFFVLCKKTVPIATRLV